MNKLLYAFCACYLLAHPLKAQLAPERPLPGQISSQDAHTVLDNFDRLPENIKTSEYLNAYVKTKNTGISA